MGHDTRINFIDDGKYLRESWIVKDKIVTELNERGYLRNPEMYVN